MAERNKVPTVAVTLPADAKDVKQTKDSIKFTVGKGKAKAAVESFRKQFRDAGWKEDSLHWHAWPAHSYSQKKTGKE